METTAIAGCLRCGRENRAAAAFCDQCGASLRPPLEESVRLPGPAPGGSELFIGRERELAVLGAALEESLGGQGRILMLAGEPGIGKTRTAEVLARYAAQRDARVLWGRCYEEPGAPPYWPWLQVIRACAEAHDDASLHTMLGSGASDLAGIVPDLAQRCSRMPRRSDAPSAPRCCKPPPCAGGRRVTECVT